MIGFTDLERILYSEQYMRWLTSIWGHIATRYSLTIQDKEQKFLTEQTARRRHETTK